MKDQLELELVIFAVKKIVKFKLVNCIVEVLDGFWGTLTFGLPKLRSQGDLIRKQPTMLCTLLYPGIF